MVIGLCGKMGAGKDAAAALLTMLGFERHAFGDALRLEVAEAIKAGEVDALEADVWGKPTRPEMRVLLQGWGMMRRKEQPGYWVEKVRREIARVGRAVLSDVRFEDEAAMIWEAGGEVWRIERPGAGAGPGADHISESIPFEADRVIVNDGTLEQLARRVLAAFERAEGQRRKLAAHV